MMGRNDIFHLIVLQSRIKTAIEQADIDIACPRGSGLDTIPDRLVISILRTGSEERDPPAMLRRRPMRSAPLPTPNTRYQNKHQKAAIPSHAVHPAYWPSW
ncbi:MAG: hypothetical protein ABF665_05880 [Gluconacetobacter sp.]